MLFRLAGAIVVLVSLAQGAAAQSLEDRLRDQLRQTTEQLRQLQDGQAALQARATAAEAERDNLKKQVAALQAQVSHPQIKRNDAAMAALQSQVTRDKGALSQAASSVQEAQAEHERLQTTVTNQATMLSVCQQKNAQLLKISSDILDKFEHVDWWDDMNLAEPFVQDTRVNLQKVAQDYGDQIYDAKFDPRTVKLAPANAQKPANAPATQNPAPAQKPESPPATQNAAPVAH
jgi:DNA repair exonuclease SbcCD ATPase subunit